MALDGRLDHALVRGLHGKVIVVKGERHVKLVAGDAALVEFVLPAAQPDGPDDAVGLEILERDLVAHGDAAGSGPFFGAGPRGLVGALCGG